MDDQIDGAVRAIVEGAQIRRGEGVDLRQFFDEVDALKSSLGEDEAVIRGKMVWLGGTVVNWLRRVQEEKQRRNQKKLL